MVDRRSAPAQFVFLVLGRGASAVLQALTLVWFARSVSPGEFGVVSAVLGIGIVLMGVFDLGMTALVIRESARENAPLVAAALRINRLASLALAAVGTGSLALLAASSLPIALSMLPLAASVALEKFADARLGVALASGRAWLVTAGLLGRRVATLATYGMLLLIGVSPVLAFATASAAGGVSAVVVALTGVRTPKASPRVPGGKVFRSALPYWVNSMASQLRNLDTAIVAVMGGAIHAAQYAVASRVIGPLQLAVTAAASVILPTAARQEGNARRQLVRVLYLLCAVAAGGYLVIALSAQWWVPLVLGAPYSGAVMTVAVVTLGLVPMSFGEVAKATLQGWGAADRVAYVSVAGGIAVVALVAFGATWNGSVGAGLGFVVAMTGQAVAWARMLHTYAHEGGG